MPTQIEAERPAVAPPIGMTTNVDEVREKILRIGAGLRAGLIERDDEVSMLLTAIVSGENALLVSAPGCAKSLMVDSLMRAIDGPTFSILLTKYTAPEEVMGPLSMPALKEGRYVRNIENRLPSAVAAFIDEVWKSSSSILNTLLRLLNERQYENDGAWHQSPLRFVVGASNEYPNPENGGAELGAIFDRFAFRKSLKPIRSKKGIDRLLFGDNLGPVVTEKLTVEEIDLARASASSVTWEKESRVAMRQVLKYLASAGVVPSDRRRRKAAGAAKAAAWLAGSNVVKSDHLECLSDVLWDDPTEQPAKVAEAIAKVCNPVGLRVSQLVSEADSILAGYDPKTCDAAKAAPIISKIKNILERLGKLRPDAGAEAAFIHIKGVSESIVRDLFGG